MSRLLLSSCFLCLSLTGCARSLYEEIDPQEGITRLSGGGSIEAEVRDVSEPLLASGENIGIIVGVVTPERKPQIFSYGKSNLATGEPITSRSIFGIGSVTKSFIATLVAIMVREGRLSYDETLRDIMPPSFAIPDPRVAKITVRQLVTHTSGFAREPWNMQSLLDILGFIAKGDNPYEFVDEDMARSYLAQAQVRPEDQKYVYSNIGMAYLGQILQIKSGQTLNALLQEKICQPLGLRDTTYELSAEQRTRLVQGYSGDHPKLMLRNRPVGTWQMRPTMQGAAGLFSSVEDLLIFTKANMGMSESPLVPVFQRTHEIYLRRELEEDVAYGWFVQKFASSSQRIFYQYGLFGGHNAYIGFDDERKTAVVVLRNNFNWKERIGSNLIRRLAFGQKIEFLHTQK